MKTFEHLTEKSKRVRVSVPLVGTRHPATKMSIPVSLRQRLAQVADGKCRTTAMVALADWALDELERQGLSLTSMPGPGVMKVHNEVRK